MTERYKAGFTTWEKDGYLPLRVPAKIRTTKGPRIPMSIGGNPWQIGIAAVEPEGEDWLEWQPLRAP